ncbi:Bas1p Ecym_4008 [Eremothecium cymbalariae DBVPG|uniref:Uncharacterized protein n=1 Tax=Eremothecium cymbalariae (strain CBS 270.75 / DBVPG 7215 / KCTC 17166 / NRRL Y-17582) TaxID=931890 RepID=G8JST9_ERECY|nr:hypothetical protein Ecym_4008 [Eremothecium cymbalariae DBVPG\
MGSMEVDGIKTNASKCVRTKKVKMRREQINPLDVTESLGFQTHRRGIRKPWSKKDDDILRKAVDECLVEMGYANGIVSITSIRESQMVCKKIPWEKVVLNFDTNVRKPKDVRKRWTSSLDPNLKKGRWTAEEDLLLLKSYEKHGAQWLKISQELAGRTEDQCAKRYIEVLDPSTKDRLRGWTLEEDLALISKVKIYGTKWRQISSEMESRPSLTCRNRWRKIITMIMRGKASDVITRAVESGRGMPTLESLRTTVLEQPDASKVSDGDTIQQLSQLQQATSPVPNPGSCNPPVMQRATSPNIYDCEPLSRSETPVFIQQALSPLGQTITKRSHDESTKKSTSINKSASESPQLSSISPGLGYPGAGSPQLPFGHPSSLSTKMARPSSSSVGEATFSSIIPAASLLNTPTSVPGPPLNSATDPPRTRQPDYTATDWKYSLKNHQDIAISSGDINSSTLVKELIECAKKHCLSISVHQHINNHYISPASYHQQQKRFNVASPLGGVCNTQDGATGTDFDLHADFLQRNHSFDSIPLETLQRMNTSGYFPSSNQVATAPYSHQKIENMTSMSSHKTHCRDIPEIAPQRLTHFNALPPHVKLQLGSSEPIKANTEQLNNTSPLNSVTIQSKKRRKRSRNNSADTILLSAATSATATPKSSAGSPGKKLQKGGNQRSSVTDTNAVLIAPEEDDEMDFWESLRSLGATTTNNGSTSNNIQQGSKEGVQYPNTSNPTNFDGTSSQLSQKKDDARSLKDPKEVDSSLKSAKSNLDFWLMNEEIHKGLPFNPS